MVKTSTIGGTDAIRDRLREASEFDVARLPRLANIAQDWALNISNALRSLVVTPARISLLSVGMEGSPVRNDGVLYAPVRIKRSEVGGYASFEVESLDTLTAALFGGDPAGPDSGSARLPTALDRALVKLVMEHAVSAGVRAFTPVFPLDMQAGDLVDLRRLLSPNAEAEDPEDEDGEDQATVPERRYGVFRFGLSVKSAKAELVFAIPEEALATHRRALSAPLPQTPKDRDESWANAIRSSFVESDMRVDALLAKMEVSLAEVAALRVGKTIPLPLGPAGQITLVCESQPLFRAHMGRSQDSYVARIDERIHPEEDFIDGILSR